MDDAAIDAVCFDLDDTLCAYRRSPAELLDYAFRAVGVDPFFTVEAYTAVFDSILPTVDDMATLRRRAFASLARDAGVDVQVAHVVADAYTARRDGSAIEWCAGARRLFEAVVARHPTAIVTNGVRDAQQAKLAALDIDERVDAIIVGGDDLPPKPAPDPFEHAMAALETVPDRTVHIGNSLDHDVVGAKAAGMRAIWIAHGSDRPSEHGGAKPDLIAATPAEVLPLPWDRA